MAVAYCLDSNVLVYAFSKAPRDAAKARVAREWISRGAGSRPVIPIDVPLMRHALQLKSRYGIAYWDAAVIAGAHRLGASTLVSEDLAHGQEYGGVRVFNPFAGS